MFNPLILCLTVALSSILTQCTLYLEFVPLGCRPTLFRTEH